MRNISRNWLLLFIVALVLISTFGFTTNRRSSHHHFVPSHHTSKIVNIDSNHHCSIVPPYHTPRSVVPSYHTSKTQLNALPITSTLTSPAVQDVALISSSVLILGSYHINLYRREKNSTIKTWRQYQADTREYWSRHVRDTEGWLYAIQESPRLYCFII